MEAKQIEARICGWPRVVNSVATKGDFRRFSPNIFPKIFLRSSIYNYIKRHLNIY